MECSMFIKLLCFDSEMCPIGIKIESSKILEFFGQNILVCYPIVIYKIGHPAMFVKYIIEPSTIVREMSNIESVQLKMLNKLKHVVI